MSLRKTAWIGFAILATLQFGGCPGSTGGDGAGNANDNSDSTGPKEITGRYSGVLNCLTTTTVAGGANPSAQNSTLNLSIEFGTDGKPVSVLVPGYSTAADQSTTVNDVGETANLTGTASGKTSTHAVTVRSTTYTSTSAKIVIDIVYSGASGALTESGTGVLTIDASVSGNALSYSAEANYTVDLMFGGGSIGSTETSTCTGTLTRQ